MSDPVHGDQEQLFPGGSLRVGVPGSPVLMRPHAPMGPEGEAGPRSNPRSQTPVT